MSGDVEALADILRAHRCVDGFMPPNSTESVVWRKYACSCGWWSTADQERDFTDHVASMLAAYAQTVRAEALEEAAKEATRGPGWGPGLSHFEDRLRVHRWLGAKAAALRAQPAADTTPDTP